MWGGRDRGRGRGRKRESGRQRDGETKREGRGEEGEIGEGRERAREKEGGRPGGRGGQRDEDRGRRGERGGSRERGAGGKQRGRQRETGQNSYLTYKCQTLKFYDSSILLVELFLFKQFSVTMHFQGHSNIRHFKMKIVFDFQSVLVVSDITALPRFPCIICG